MLELNRPQSKDVQCHNFEWVLLVHLSFIQHHPGDEVACNSKRLVALLLA